MTSEDSLPSPDHNSRSVSDDEYDLLVPPYVADGNIGTPADTDLIFGDSSARVVKIRANRFALVRGRLWESASTTASLSISANTSGSTRFDLIVLRYTLATYNVRATVIAGSPGSGVPTPLNNGTSFDMPVASVIVVNGAPVINDSDVTSMAWFVSPQPVVCTSTTRPPHAPNKRILETDTGMEYTSDGINWIHGLGDSGDVAVTGLPGWVLSSCFVRKRDGVVYFRGGVTRSGAALGVSTASNFLQIPDGFKPPYPVRLGAYQDGGFLVLVEVTTGGVMDAHAHRAAPIANGDLLSIFDGSWPAA